MMSCTTSVAWSRPVSSPCYTEHGRRYGVVLSGRITTVTMSRSDQLGLCCTVEPNCSDMSARLVGASVTRSRDLVTCESSCVPRTARLSFISMVHSPLGSRGVRGSTGALLSRRRGRGYVAAPEPISTRRRGPELRNTWQRRSLTQQGGEVRGHGTRGSTGSHLSKEVRS
jgi:hypothetical protein